MILNPKQVLFRETGDDTEKMKKKKNVVSLFKFRRGYKAQFGPKIWDTL